jgi:putative hydrolase of HD superfamily
MKKKPPRDLARRLRFLCEIDKVKSIYRHTLLMDGSRQENDAEHAWHLAIMALLFADLSKKPDIDLFKVLSMVLIHDIVEIDCGDAFVYDEKLRAKKKLQEARAARRIFGLLPTRLSRRFLSLWEEFERRESAEAKFAAALDRFQPILHNYMTRGRVWKKEGVDAEKVLRINAHIDAGAPALWEQVKKMVLRGSRRGYFGKKPRIRG